MIRGFCVSLFCLLVWSVAPSEPASTMVLIPGGTFVMGDHLAEGRPNESPAHQVTLPAFYLSSTELTIREFATFVAATDYRTYAEQDRGSTIWRDGAWQPNTAGIHWRHDYLGQLVPPSDYDLPVVHLSWYDAIAYCNWKSTTSGFAPVYTITLTGQVTADWSANGFRLPTEAEWEYAARSGGQNNRFGNGTDVLHPAEANFYNRPDPAIQYVVPGDSYGRLMPVAVHSRPNALGLYDMAGNAWEWCWDGYGPYPSTSLTHPKGSTISDERICRGGGWTTSATGCRATYRNHYTPGSRSPFVGFRLARNSTPNR